MKLNLLKLSAFICIAAFFQCSSAKKNAANGNSTATIFFDDFSGSSLDRSKWSVRITGMTVNNEQQAYVDSSATIYIAQGKQAEGAKNGALVLHPRFSQGFTTPEGKKFDFISGRIDTRGKMEFNHGSASARIKMTEGLGLWPAWWILGTGRWPETGEIDIMEYIGEKDWISAALHGPGYSGNTPLAKKDTLESRNSITNWHVYAVDWTNDSLMFKVDGRVFYTVTRPMVERYGKWSYDNNKYLILNFALGGGYPAGVNKVKEPYYGLPQSTVDLIKQGKAKILVDWVRVTKD